MKALCTILSLVKQMKDSTLCSHIFHMFCFAFSRNAHTNHGPLKVKKKPNQPTKKTKQNKNPKIKKKNNNTKNLKQAKKTHKKARKHT